MALYDPEEGYYARGSGQVGRGGDFFTSVSVGPLFGMLLARRFHRFWKEIGSPTRWRITECGAHDGTLAADILTALAEISPPACGRLEYLILEPLTALRATQQGKLAGFAPRVRWECSAAGAEALPGVVFGNELLDALPFHAVTFRDGRWHERSVALDAEGGFRWELREIGTGPLADALTALPVALPDGYETEIRTGIRGFLEPLAGLLERGLMVWPDYGFVRADYYHPARTTGTMRTFARHRAGENPLESPGTRDITAHVDFTTVAGAITCLGGTPAPLASQGRWLTEIAREWLLAQEGRPDAALLRQFQTLTHPGHLGRGFAVLEATFR